MQSTLFKGRKIQNLQSKFADNNLVKLIVFVAETRGVDESDEESPGENIDRTE
jgi:hypothetical protein